MAFLLADSNQTHSLDYLVLARNARDILAIPGVSISVERLFSSSKHTLSDTCSLLTAISASKTVVTKEWLKKGYGVDINYLDDVCIHSQYYYNIINYEYKLNTIHYNYDMNRYRALALGYDMNIL